MSFEVKKVTSYILQCLFYLILGKIIFVVIRPYLEINFYSINIIVGFRIHDLICIYIYTDSEFIVSTRWGSLKLAPITAIVYFLKTIGFHPLNPYLLCSKRLILFLVELL